MKSLLEKSAMLKLGPLGNKALEPADEARSIALVLVMVAADQLNGWSHLRRRSAT